MYCRNLNYLFFLWVSFFSLKAWHCDLISLQEIYPLDENIIYQHCYDEIPFEYQKLPFERDHFLHPHKGNFSSSYIVTIPQGKVIGVDGSVIFNKKLVSNFVWQNCFIEKSIWENIQERTVVNISNSVAVLAQAGHTYYYHWLVEILGRLALLEMENIEYDYLYVPYNRHFMKETLSLWGIDSERIIEASDGYILQAQKLIIPSLIAQVKTYGVERLSHYMPKHILLHIKNRLLTGYQKQFHDFDFDKRVFVSRADATSRKMLNEDEVFKKFEEHGFKKYVLSQMSIVEQIALFQGAEIIIGSLGSGMSNVLFCNPDVKVFDIFQRRCDCTIFYMCQTLGLEYYPIKTMDFTDKNDGQCDAVVPLESLEQILQYL